MSAARVGLGVATGYLLGRTKKMRLAITLGSMIAGQRVANNPVGLLRQASALAEKSPQLAELQQRVTGELFEAARSAALATATSRLESANKALLSRGSSDEESDDESDDEYDDQDEDEYDEDEDEYDDEYDDDEADEDEADEEEPVDEEEPADEDEADEEEPVDEEEPA